MTAPTPIKRNLPEAGCRSTRADYDFRYDSANAADQTVLAPAPRPATGTFSSTATMFPLPARLRCGRFVAVRLSSTTPDRYGENQVVTMTLTGAGFVPGTTVKLIPTAGGSDVNTATVSIDTYTQITATFNLTGVPQGNYTVYVQHPSGDSDQAPNAFTVIPGGAAKLKRSSSCPAHSATTRSRRSISNTPTRATPPCPHRCCCFKALMPTIPITQF